MWIEKSDKAIINTDWITAIVICYEEDSNSPFQIRAYEKGSEGWHDFGVFETFEEAEQELEKIKSKLLSKQ